MYVECGMRNRVLGEQDEESVMMIDEEGGREKTR